MVVECYSSRIKVFSMTIDMYGNVNYGTDFTYVGMFLKNNKLKILLDVVVKISDCPSCISDELRRMRHPELVFED